MIQGKTLQELRELEQEIEQTLGYDRSMAMELQYWAGILKRIKGEQARKGLAEMWDRWIRDNRGRVEEEVNKRKGQGEKGGDGQYKTPFTALMIDNLKKRGDGEEAGKKGGEEEKDQDGDYQQQQSAPTYNDGSLSPVPIPLSEAGYLLSLALTPDEDAKLLSDHRALYLLKHKHTTLLHREEEAKKPVVERVKKTALNTKVRFDIDNMGYDNSSLAMYEELKRKGLGQDEQEFTDMVQKADSQYGWADKYKPRKPRFFNTVLTGYEWNKYNQTHYDADNPPPKIVQGYKFNIFYPDLLDKTKTPQFLLEPGDTPDTLVIIFHAGPPYEDLAFKILNKEWEMSERHEFRCVFDRGVLQLYFNFKKHRYRR